MNMIKPVLLLLLVSLPLPGLGDNDHDMAKHLKDTGNILSLEIILKNARAIIPGKILEAELESEDGKLIYEIELLTPEGKVIELLFDAQTGKHIATEIED
ncbi:MAG: PepSY domain-containing protein [Gammaproteobacteria bacterium]|nr:PepSY domain-containing protein [Gammaproteobacteria bacterium]